MCRVYLTTSIVGQDREVLGYTIECDKKPPGGTPQQCPAYKAISAASSRKKKELPIWATSKNKKANSLPPTPE
jgi:hypothetical protein